jgi:hypothetical protein
MDSKSDEFCRMTIRVNQAMTDVVSEETLDWHNYQAERQKLATSKP